MTENVVRLIATRRLDNQIHLDDGLLTNGPTTWSIAYLPIIGY